MSTPRSFKLFLSFLLSFNRSFLPVPSPPTKLLTSQLPPVYRQNIDNKYIDSVK